MIRKVLLACTMIAACALGACDTDESADAGTCTANTSGSCAERIARCQNIPGGGVVCPCGEDPAYVALVECLEQAGAIISNAIECQCYGQYFACAGSGVDGGGEHYDGCLY